MYQFINATLYEKQAAYMRVIHWAQKHNVLIEDLTDEQILHILKFSNG